MRCEFCGCYMIDDMERAQGFCWDCAGKMALKEEEYVKNMEEFEEKQRSEDENLENE